MHHLVRSRFNTDFTEILTRISREVAAADGSDAGVVAEDIRNNMIAWFGDFLRRNYGPYAALRRHLRVNMPDLLEWMKTRRRYAVPLERRKVLATLRRNGASADYLQAFKTRIGADR